MHRRIRTAFAGPVACIVAVIALVFGSASPAAAFGAETFGCRIAPGTVFTFNTSCTNTKPASTYGVGFAVLNTSGTYTYSWTITGPYLAITEGCTSTSYDCAVSVSGTGPEKDITGAVTYTQNGQSATQYAYATILQYCC